MFKWLALLVMAKKQGRLAIVDDSFGSVWLVYWEHQYFYRYGQIYKYNILFIWLQ